MPKIKGKAKKKMPAPMPLKGMHKMPDGSKMPNAEMKAKHY